MDNDFPNNVSILIDKLKKSSEFHICEVGYEKCRSTKPVEFKPIDYWVLHYCVSGEGFFSTPYFLEKKISMGDFFVIPAYCKNSYYPNRENPWNYRWIGFSGSLVSEYMNQLGLGKDQCIFKDSFDNKINTIFQKVYDEFKLKNSFGILSRTYSLFDYMHKKREESKLLTQSEWLFKNIEEYINDHLTEEKLSVARVAQEYKINRTYLFKLFQKYEKMNPSTYIQELRLQRACSLLQKSSLNITEISYEVGFSSSSYFSKFFVSKKGISPSTYRNRYMQ